MKNFLKKHWGNIAALATPAIAFLTPSLNAYAGAHPKTAAGIAVAVLVGLYNSTAPKDRAQLK